MSFTRATCGNPICTPSRAEILSGCSGFTNGVIDFGKRIDPKLATWSNTMQQAGYRTGYVGKWHNDGRPHLRGYQESFGLFTGGGRKAKHLKFLYPEDSNHHKATGYRGWVFQTSEGKLLPQKGTGLLPNISGKFADAAIEFLKTPTQKQQPFFLHVNFTTPHDPLLMPTGYEKMYDPNKMQVPENFLKQHPFDHGNLKGRDEVLWQFPRTKKDVREELAVYYATISYMDAQIGRIIQALKKSGQYDNTLIIYSSDHGLSVGSHGLRGKQSMYEHTIGVPLIIAGPGIKPNTKTAAQCYLRDLFPTACACTGIDIPKTVEGKSLLPVLQQKTKTIYPHIFGYFRNFQRMIRTDDWKLIHYPHINRYQMFNITKDPKELNNLATVAEHAATFKELKTKLETWQRKVNDPVLK